MKTPRRSTLGPFRLEEKIGEGGMGVVYRAHDPQLHRWVAIKRIHSRYESVEDYRQRFLGEARAVAAVSHPNIAQIFSIHGSEGDDPAFFVMEYIEGLSVEERVRREGALPIIDALEITRQAARGLRAAQRGGIIHRDVKPSNLLLDERQQVKLVDFGLALRLDELDELTDDEDRILCTPHYVSPEQARGWRIDHRSDIYSLGCTLYFILTGKEPFQRENRVDLFVAHANETVALPGTVRPEVPASVDALIGRMLEKRPEDRPHDYDTLLTEIDQIRTELSPTATTGTPPRRRAGRLVVTVLGLALIATGAWWFDRGPRTPPFPVETHFRGIYIADSPYEKLHYDFTAESAGTVLAPHFRYTVPADSVGAGEIVLPPALHKRTLYWKNYSGSVRLPYLSEFKEIELRGVVLLRKQDFRLVIGDDPEFAAGSWLHLTFTVDPERTNREVVDCSYHGEVVPVEILEPAALDFRVKNEPYIVRLVREDSTNVDWATYRFVLEQETEESRTAVQARIRFRIPADRVPEGAISIQTVAPYPNQWTVSIEQILVRGRLDRERLALERARGRI